MANTQAGDSPVIDLVEFIDHQPVGGFQIRLLLLCAAVLFLDGFDTQAIGYVAPAIAKEWGLTKGALGPVFSAGLFGLMIGALVFGPLADHIGRKKIIIFSTAAFGVGALVTAFVHDVSALLVIRFLTGLGLGGAMPNTVAMTSEFNPQRRRATMVMIMFCGFSVGAALGGLLAADLIPRFGWRAVFIVGGIAPLLMLPILVWRLPESVRFLATFGHAPERVAELLKRISPNTAFAPEARFVVHETHLAGLPVKHLFREGRSLATSLLWVVFFMSLLDIYFLANWLPTVLNDLGASVSEAVLIGSLLQIGGVAGTLALGSIIDRFSFWRWRWSISAPFSRSARSARSATPRSWYRLRSLVPASAWSAARSPPTRLPRTSIRPQCGRPVSVGRSASAASVRSSARWLAGCCWPRNGARRRSSWRRLRRHSARRWQRWR